MLSEQNVHTGARKSKQDPSHRRSSPFFITDCFFVHGSGIFSRTYLYGQIDGCPAIRSEHKRKGFAHKRSKVVSMSAVTATQL